VTRSHKQNDRDHVGLADGTAAPEEHLPRYFAKSGHIDADPKKVKKEGGGKGNWCVVSVNAGKYKMLTSRSRGRSGEEAEDYGYNFANARRRSNSSTHGNAIGDFKTKFEAVEADPVFEEEYHGAAGGTEGEEGLALEKEDSAESTSGGSIEEEERAKRA
jgi:hypothetical protein